MKNTSEIEAKEFFERLGFDATPIAEVAGRRRADLRISDSRNSYIVEIKTREGSFFEDDLAKHGTAESLVVRIAIPCQGLWQMRSNSLTPHSDIPTNFDYFGITISMRMSVNRSARRSTALSQLFVLVQLAQPLSTVSILRLVSLLLPAISPRGFRTPTRRTPVSKRVVTHMRRIPFITALRFVHGT